MVEKPQLSFTEALTLSTQKIFDISGRSRRSEFWWTMLLAYIISCIVPFVMLLTIPLQVRRLHDTGRSGWWLLLPIVFDIVACVMAIPLFFAALEEGAEAEALLSAGIIMGFLLVGLVSCVLSVIMLVFFCQDSQKGPNQYGESPKYSDDFTNVGPTPDGGASSIYNY